MKKQIGKWIAALFGGRHCAESGRLQQRPCQRQRKRAGIHRQQHGCI